MARRALSWGPFVKSVRPRDHTVCQEEKADEDEQDHDDRLGDSWRLDLSLLCAGCGESGRQLTRVEYGGNVRQLCYLCWIGAGAQMRGEASQSQSLRGRKRRVSARSADSARRNSECAKRLPPPPCPSVSDRPPPAPPCWPPPARGNRDILEAPAPPLLAPPLLGRTAGDENCAGFYEGSTIPGCNQARYSRAKALRSRVAAVRPERTYGGVNHLFEDPRTALTQQVDSGASMVAFGSQPEKASASRSGSASRSRGKRRSAPAGLEEADMARPRTDGRTSTTARGGQSKQKYRMASQGPVALFKW